jgi:hypothetical protein
MAIVGDHGHLFLLLHCIYTTISSPPERRPNVVIADKNPPARWRLVRLAAMGIQVVYKARCAAIRPRLSCACEGR